jgi:chromosome segregation ATPase
MADMVAYKSSVFIFMMATMDELKEMLVALTTEVKDHRNEMKTSIKIIEEKISNISLRVSANEKDLKNYAAQTEANTEDILANKNEIEPLKDSLKLLQNDNAKLTKSLDEQIDRNMRESRNKTLEKSLESTPS